MRILVIGSGGREHALCWAIAASPLCDALFCAPGNPGIAEEAVTVPVSADDVEGILALCRRERIDFVVIGPEAPLAAGLADRLEAEGFPAFGPSEAAAALEGSKGFTKDLCARHGIPTAAYRRFDDPERAREFVREKGVPIVIKADGLAAGKGVTIAMSGPEAVAAIDAARRYGNALVIEEFLEGEEVSVFALVDGTHILLLASAQDHKRVGDGDTGPNTGGMGAYSPAPCLTPSLEREVMEKILRPTVAAMKAEGRPFKGVLYAGLMLTARGPMLIEYNVRFGDPECQVLMLRLKSDLLPALIAARDGVLNDFDLRWHEEAALTVVMAAEGYPEAPRKGSVIEGVEEASTVEGVKIFHAGTAMEAGHLIAAGGRVLNVTAVGRDVREARDRAYAAIARLHWPQGFCRHDIGWRAITPEPR
ncbi:MAG TPA: phosphoribosylamine--glycine ligase [Stellaceae bacterium]|nr:phosphoribosylamine--glycine ligase [Stellaceae bacterium]